MYLNYENKLYFSCVFFVWDYEELHALCRRVSNKVDAKEVQVHKKEPMEVCAGFNFPACSQRNSSWSYIFRPVKWIKTSEFWHDSCCVKEHIQPLVACCFPIPLSIFGHGNRRHIFGNSWEVLIIISLEKNLPDVSIDKWTTECWHLTNHCHMWLNIPLQS